MWFQSYLSVTKQSLAVNVDGVFLKPVSTQWRLVFDDQWQWYSYISHVCKKISYYSYWINTRYKNLPNDVLKWLVDSLALIMTQLT